MRSRRAFFGAEAASVSAPINAVVSIPVAMPSIPMLTMRSYGSCEVQSTRFQVLRVKGSPRPKSGREERVTPTSRRGGR
jgi:hypothetical protein